jgi:hypothetical protein
MDIRNSSQEITALSHSSVLNALLFPTQAKRKKHLKYYEQKETSDMLW